MMPHIMHPLIEYGLPEILCSVFFSKAEIWKEVYVVVFELIPEANLSLAIMRFHLL